MDWFLWSIVAWWALNALFAVALIGKRREAITPGIAVGMIVVYAAMITGLLVTR